MAQGTWTTTPDEDAAILALSPQETVPQFITRHLRHQVDFALSQVVLSVNADIDAAYHAATPQDQAAVDAILAKTKPVKGAKP